MGCDVGAHIFLYLPSNLRDFQIELAGKLVVMDNPGQEVKALRERYRFTQDWLAKLMDLRRESLSRIESGHVTPSVGFIQRFTKIVTLARGVREHMAYVEARDNPVDEALLAMLAVGLRLEKAAADEVILTSQINYAEKRKQALRSLGGR